MSIRSIIATLKRLIIPEGVVKQIIDENGKIIWRADKTAICKHERGEPVLVREPTCTVPAEYVIHCILCGLELDRYEDVGEFADHIPNDGRVTVVPTCTTTGIRKYHCSVCGTWVRDEVVAVLGHIWTNPYYSNEFSSGYGHKCSVCGELEELPYVECTHPESARHESVITNPTCTEVGSKTCSCDVCRTSWSEEIAALGHVFVESVVIDNTCISPAIQKYACFRCDIEKPFEESDIIRPPLGHNFVESVVIDNTCTEPAIQKYSCSRCGIEKPFEESDIIRPPLGHTWGDPYYSNEFSSGYGHKCDRCGETEELTYVECIHPETAYSESVIINPTCTEVGSKTCSCDVCHISWSEEIAALGHSFVESVVIDNTCTEPAIQKYSCFRCGIEKPFEESDIIRPPLGHTWGDPYYSNEFSSGYGQKCALCGELMELDYVECAHPESARHESVIVKPTCTEVGSKTCSCDVCRESWTVSMPALGHGYVESIVIDNTCTEPAIQKYSCSRCGIEKPFEESDIIRPPLGHNYVESIVIDNTCTEPAIQKYSCSRCGIEKPFEESDIIRPPLGHAWTDPYYSNMFSSGYGHKCSVCGELEELDYVECAHPESARHESVITNPTCITDGNKNCSCDICRTSWSEDIAALGHDMPIVGVITNPTCTKGGYTTWTCNRKCGYSETGNYTSALGHTRGNPVCVREATCTVAPVYTVSCVVCNIELDRYEDDGGLLEHISDGGRVTTAATCTTTGIRKYYCRECSTWIRDEVIPALGHSYTSKVTAPTCTESGYTTHICSVCGYSYKDNETDPNGHDFSYGWVVTKSPTCTSTGTVRKTCVTCGYYEEQTVAALEHGYTSKVTAPTCTIKGYTTYTCSTCGHSYIDNETAALGHNGGTPVRIREATCTVPAQYAVYCTRCSVEIDRYENDGEFAEHTPNAGVVTTNPTCVATGIRKYHCSKCGTWIKDETVAATGTHTYSSVVIAPTCTDGGYTTHTCTVCGHSHTDNETDPNGHSWGVDGGWVTVTPATCVDKGKEKHTCNACGLVDTRDIPATGHSYTSKVTAPTCTAKGYTTHTCTVCGYSYTDTETAALGHNYEYDRTEDATCESGGYDVYTCTRCGDWYTANETEANGHSFPDGWVTEKEATCEETGTERRTCDTCGYYEERDIPLADHDYEAIEDSSQSSGYIGVCRVCGHVEEDHAPQSE